MSSEYMKAVADDVAFCDEFLQGQKDCKEGVIHRDGMGDNYDLGFECQYQHEANMNAQELRL